MIAVPGTISHGERAREICSLLIANGYIARDEFKDLQYDESLRERVAENLDAVGLRLLQNTGSNFWGVGLSAATAGDDRLEWSNNAGLDRGAVALLLILWCKLILPKRLSADGNPTDLADTLFPDLEFKAEPLSSITRDQIVAEYGAVLGGVTLTAKYLAQLARAKLIRTHCGIIEEGPLMALAIDEHQLTGDLQREVLMTVLKRETKTRRN